MPEEGGIGWDFHGIGLVAYGVLPTPGRVPIKRHGYMYIGTYPSTCVEKPTFSAGHDCNRCSRDEKCTATYIIIAAERALMTYSVSRVLRGFLVLLVRDLRGRPLRLAKPGRRLSAMPSCRPVTKWKAGRALAWGFA